MIKMWYSTERKAVIAERLVSVAIYDRNGGIDQDSLLERINQIESEEECGLRSIPFSDELWSEILAIGEIIDDD